MTNDKELLTYLVSLDIDALDFEALLKLAKMLEINLVSLEPDYIIKEVKQSIDFYRVFWM